MLYIKVFLIMVFVPKFLNPTIKSDIILHIDLGRQLVILFDI